MNATWAREKNHGNKKCVSKESLGNKLTILESCGNGRIAIVPTF